MSVLGPTVSRKQDLISRLAAARANTDALFGVIRDAALYDRPIPERHRIVFYIGHLEAFDWNLLARGPFQIQPFADALDRLFAFGIDPVDGGLPSDLPSAWPEIGAVRDYVHRSRTILDERIDAADLEAGDLRTRIEVAIEHRLMHSETLGYMFHQLPDDRKHPVEDPPAPAGRGRRGTVAIPGGTVTLGLERGAAFGWDNEFERHTAAVPAFAIDADSVDQGMWLEFMDAGGYARRELWDEAAWAWRDAENLNHPRFWRRSGREWRRRGMFAERPIVPEEPVYVSHAEATAYARWRGGALPSEREFHRAAYGTPSGDERRYPWGDAPPDSSRGNFDFARWEPVPCSAYPAGDSAFGVADLVGNGWEWTSTEFAPFPGFERFPFYPGYSENFFDGKHWVMKGGSARTAACMLRPTFRNWFQGHYPYVDAKFRVVGR